MPLPVSVTSNSKQSSRSRDATVTCPPAGVNLIGIAQQVPHDLLQPGLVTHDNDVRRSLRHRHLNPLRLRLGSDDLHGGIHDGAWIDDGHFKAHLSKPNARKIKEIRGQMRLDTGIALNYLDAMAYGDRKIGGTPQDIGPPENRPQRISKLVG